MSQFSNNYDLVFKFMNLKLNHSLKISNFKFHIGRVGQTLVMLLVFMTMAITATTAAVLMAIVNSQSTLKLDQGNSALAIAESGAENALMRLLRDPAYSGETLSVGGGTAKIDVQDGAVPVVTSVGKNGAFTRTVQIQTMYSNNVLAIVSWKEIYP